jgi:hypothetical protein
LHNIRSCWEQALKGPINHALRMEITAEDRQMLLNHISRLPQSEPAEINAKSDKMTD